MGTFEGCEPLGTMVFWTFSAGVRFNGLTSPLGVRFVLTFDPRFPAWWWEDIEPCPGQVLYPSYYLVGLGHQRPWFWSNEGARPFGDRLVVV